MATLSTHSQRKYLVTGGCGFIGSNLARTLAEAGAQVTAVDNTQSGVAENLQGSEVQFIAADVTEARNWALGGSLYHLTDVNWDAIFHHGDITDPRHGDDEKVYQRNTSGFQNVLDLALKQQCRLVFASTAGLYGNGPVPMREDQPNHILTAYGKSKEEMERRAIEAGSRIPVVGLRYFNVYGPREGHKGRAASMIFHLFHQMKDGKNPRLFEFGEQKRDFVYVKDIVAANICALTAPSGIYNVGSGEAEEFNAVVAALNTALGTDLKTEFFKMPYDPATYQMNTHAEMSKAKSQLGFTPQWNLQAGVMDYVHWLQAADNQSGVSRSL
jgi:ADP-L-glycero-D-manno-heptose 6-epimerase